MARAGESLWREFKEDAHWLLPMYLGVVVALWLLSAVL